MAETFKDFQAMYKKCKPIPKGSLKEATTYAKTLKYFRFDLNNALDALEERVLEEKCSEDPIKASKIEDYCKGKEMKAVLKAVHWNLDKMVEAYKDLDKMDSDPGFAKPNIKKLVDIQNKIYEAEVAKKKRKEGKLDPKILKLQHQVNDDLEEIMNFWDVLKVVDKITSGRRGDPKKEYDARIKAIMKAKPRLSSRTKKYLDKVAPQMLDKGALKKQVEACKKAHKVLEGVAKAVEAAIKKQEDNVLKAKISEGGKKLVEIDNIDDKYTKILKKYDKEISKSKDNKAILKATKTIGDIQDKADDLWDETKAKITDYFEEKKKQAS